MKRFVVLSLLIAVCGVSNHAQAQIDQSGLAWGLALGGAHGTNAPRDMWVPQARGYLQMRLISSMLLGQVGVGYTQLQDPGVYSTKTGMADVRLLFSPFTMENLNPFLYGGIGLSKSFIGSGNDYLAMIPFGLGIQTRISSMILLEVSGGYSLSLSDQLDGRVRADNDLNALTNGKQDAFYGFSIGLAFSLGRGFDAAEQQKKQELADAEARRVKQQADADAEARRVRQQTDAEARRVRELADAEALRNRQQAGAVAEAQRVKDSTDAAARSAKEKSDAEARRLKDSSDARALRMAEQKPAETRTIIVLEKGKKVVLKGVNFESGRATLRRDSETILTIAYNALVANPDVRVEISGHTDNVGSDQSNQRLSLERAQAVRNWLVQKGIASNRMNAVGKGEMEPIASNNTDGGRADNRRIEFFVQE